MSEVLFEAGSWKVTKTMFQTPRTTHDLSAIQSVRVRRQLMFSTALPVAGVLVFVVAFYRYLYPTEIIAAAAIGAVVLWASVSFGTLTVQSLVTANDPSMGTSWGTIWRLTKVRDAIAKAIAGRGQG